MDKAMVATEFAGYDYAFVLFDPASSRTLRFNETRCAERLPPCSTFKIPNAVIALDTGVVQGPDHKFSWDGKKRMISDWNKDHTLRTAIRDSVVWYFQKVASAVGSKRMQRYLDGFDYGNRDITGGITTFWLGSTLRISADEQVSFLRKLYNEELPASKRAQATVKELIQLEKTNGGELSGKTGSLLDSAGKGTLGWFVGYVVHAGHPYYFASNIQAADGASGRKAKQLTINLLRKAELL